MKVSEKIILLTEEEIIREVIEDNNKDDERECNTKSERNRRPYEKEDNTNVHNDEEYEFMNENVEFDEQKQDNYVNTQSAKWQAVKNHETTT